MACIRVNCDMPPFALQEAAFQALKGGFLEPEKPPLGSRDV